MSARRYGIYLERFGENDIALGKDLIFTPQFRLTLEQVAEMSRRLESAHNRISFIEKNSSKSADITARVMNELL